MSNDPKLVNESGLIKSDDVILASPLSELNITELTRRKLLTDILSQEAEREDVIERLADRRNKRNTKSQEYESRGRELVKTGRDQAAVQNACQHKKGGRGNIPGGFLRGNDVNYSVIKHTLPTNQMYIRCTRCGKTWKPVSQFDYDMKSAEGKSAYEAAKVEYQKAIDFNTDNIESSSITFQHTSDDNNVTAQKFVHDVMKNVTLR
jgi:predicted Zn finger-like uncharacterized protein